jgi:hypothetical protein
MTAYTTQGSKVEFCKQSAFGTASTGTYKDIRVEGEPTMKTPVGTGNRPETLFINENEQEKPIVINQAMDDGATVSSLIRQPAAAGGNSWLKQMFEAGGYTIVSVDDTTVNDATATATAFDVTTVGAYAAGYGCYVNTNSQWVPALVASVATNELTLGMGLPAAPADGAAVNKALTITPGSMGEITATDLLTIKGVVKAQDGGSDVQIIGQDGAVTSLADLSLEPNEKVTIEATFGFSDVSEGTDTLAANDFADVETGVRLLHCPYAQFATANASGGITAAYHKIISAKFTWGVTAEQIVGFGSTDCKNNIQGWMQKVEPCKLSLTMLYDEQKLDDFLSPTGNESKYVAIIQPGASERDAGWGLFLPNAHQMEAPESEYWGNNEHRVTVNYTGRPAGYNSSTTNVQANQPWYFVIGDASA